MPRLSFKKRLACYLLLVAMMSALAVLVALDHLYIALAPAWITGILMGYCWRD